MHHHRKPVTISRGVLAFALSALVFILSFAGCGDSGGSSEVERLIAAARDANEKIDSYHMVLTMSFEGVETGQVRTEELVMDIAGDDVSLADTFYDTETGEGTVIQEVIRIGDRQWRADPGGSGWVEEQPNLDEDVVASYKPRISDILENSTSSVVLGEEDVNGVAATHLRFELSPENLSTLLPDIPQSSLEASTGGQVDVWLDAADHYVVKYEMVFRNVVIQEGYNSVDVHVVLDITNINQPLKIAPPV